jgi:hypothetical protein
MKFGEILDQGFALYRGNFLKLAGANALPALIMSSLQVINLTWIHLGHRLVKPEDRMDAWGMSFLVWLIFTQIASFVHPLFYPAIVKITTGSLFDEPVSAMGALRFTARRWHSYLWIDVLKNAAQTLLPWAVGFGLIVALYFADESFHLDPQEKAMGFIVALIVLAVFAVSLWIAASLAFAIPAAAVEGVRGLKAIRRSWRLSKGARFRNLFAWMMTFLITMFLWLAIGLIVRSVESFLYNTLHLHFVGQKFYLVSNYTLAAAYSAATGPIYPVILTLLYYNQRVRKEGYDVERLMHIAGMHTVDSAPSPEAAPAGEGLA